MARKYNMQNRRCAPSRKRTVTCNGGPWSGERVRIQQEYGGTMVFSVGSHTGRYTETGQWVIYINGGCNAGVGTNSANA